MTDFDKLIGRAPANVTAAQVTGRGEHWEPSVPMPPGLQHWKAPPPMPWLDFLSIKVAEKINASVGSVDASAATTKQ